MRAPSERDKCQAKLDIMVDAFIRDDWAAYRDAHGMAARFRPSEKYRTWPRDVRRQLVHAAKNRGGEEARAHASAPTSLESKW
jgi:hypothetical protein